MLIAFEGIDGSGKTTQIALLEDFLKNQGLSVKAIKFPQYNKTYSSKDIAKYLNGEFGDLNSVDPKIIALLYAGDRFESKHLLKQNNYSISLPKEEIILIDRYVVSNLVYQGARIKIDEQNKFISWLSCVEYEAYKLPKSDLTILLDISAETAHQRILKKTKRNYTDKKTDLHESNIEYLNKCRELYLKLGTEINYGENSWIVIDAESYSECIDGSVSVVSPEDISKEICWLVNDYILGDTSWGQIKS